MSCKHVYEYVQADGMVVSGEDWPVKRIFNRVLRVDGMRSAWRECFLCGLREYWNRGDWLPFASLWLVSPGTAIGDGGVYWFEEPVLEVPQCVKPYRFIDDD